MFGPVGGDKKLKNLLVGAIRRAWHRHPRRVAKVMEARVELPQYKKDGTRAAKDGVFYKCVLCGTLCKAQISKTHPRMHVDHIEPVVPVDRSYEDLTWDEFIARVFCNSDNLQVLCDTCHTDKTSQERTERAKLRQDTGRLR